MTLPSSGETASAEMSGKISAPDWSRSTGPPLGCSVAGSLRVRSGLMRVQVASAVGALQHVLRGDQQLLRVVGENRIGWVQPKRYFSSPEGAPSWYSGQGLTSWYWPVAMS